MEPIKKIISKNIKKSGLAPKVEASLVVESFSEIIAEVLSPKIAKKVQAMHLKNKTLTIACLSSVLAQEVQLHQKKIINRLNKKFDKTVVDKLRFMT